MIGFMIFSLIVAVGAVLAAMIGTDYPIIRNK